MRKDSRASITKFTASVVIIIIVAAGFGTYFGVLPVLFPQNKLNITAEMNFTIGNENEVPFFVAQSLGYYNQSGLSVNIIPSKGSAASIQAVASGAAQFALSDVPTAMVGIANSGAQVTLVGMFQPKGAICYASIQGYGINSPKDLENKSWGGPPTDAGWVLLPLFGKAAGFNASTVKLVNMAPSLRITSLIDHKIDFMTAIDGSAHQAIQVAVEKQGLTPTFLCMADYGVRMFSVGLWANNNFLTEHQAAAEKFIKATFEGVSYSIQHQNQALNIFLKYNPSLDNETSFLQIQRLPILFNSTGQKTNYLGYINPATWSQTVSDVYAYLGVKSGSLNNNLYTNQYVQQADIKYPANVG